MITASTPLTLSFADPAVAAIAALGFVRDPAVDDPLSPATAIDLDFEADSIVDALEADPRYTGLRVELAGKALPPVLRGPLTSWTSSIDQAQADFSFDALGPVWAIPSQDPPPAQGDPTAPPPPPAPPAKSPRSWGNPAVEIFLRVAATPAKIFEQQFRAGYLFSKETDGQVSLRGPFKMLDSGIKYAKLPICFSVPAFSGLHAGDIVAIAWAALGCDPAKLRCPKGPVVNRVISVQNRFFQEWVAEFGRPFRWFGSWAEDELDAFNVIELRLKDVPDHVWREQDGDWDLETMKEMPPSLPPRKLFGTATFPRPTGSAPVRVTTVVPVSALYSLEVSLDQAGTVYSDGRKRVDAAFKLMVVKEVHSTIETTDGLVTYQETRVFGYLAAQAYDPNFSTNPAGTDYTHAFGDGTFRDSHIETWRELSLDSVTNTYDQNGTPLSSVPLSRGWYAKHAVMQFFPDTAQPRNAPGSWVFAGGTARVDQAETYQDVASTGRAEYYFRPDGIAFQTRRRNSSNFAQKGRMSIFDANGQGSGTQPPDVGAPFSLVSVSASFVRTVDYYNATDVFCVISLSGIPPTWGALVNSLVVAWMTQNGAGSAPTPVKHASGGVTYYVPPGYAGAYPIVGVNQLPVVSAPGGTVEISFRIGTERIGGTLDVPPSLALYINVADSSGHGAFQLIDLGSGMFKLLPNVSPPSWGVR